ncbi:MAG: hypothetical protein A3G33_08315 [Omnitrophica bacterium RIFCSPLOWO2_12_FULL_44_17]|uniref:Uncharacterized protein n=1 Tax=Candidatus Danuiimicrobium aquiferis TaxID=1801832 RepID=A0A1G1KW50_9BACT|nr:MAG: hypothetical protein A3B72_03535 [Omnitrophica bacterium RIFCSPHIGHO2_02_FULL_45_28]OGW90528.1 MAG: hypothetical protein A3E74_03055 [Omnitrophica bacterium RIFCSPHIGHO2_12_FULL_44_12]OGW97168.1 MAG: hypothetical protein A3G33_08315 [Omnitrophica bacterium RIFCSPLOWO2_12_FULL_44_17]OGX02228.1 MAG: hypothetical protein A3J12_08100 [Omnitrophica bacterium RIFCSPLOWO2_02_FULL_44_11]
MGRLYDMVIEVSGFKTERRQKIHKAVKKEWKIDSCDFRAQDAFFSGQNNLCGGESEEEFAERVANAVWKANGVYCGVEVKATYMEELPYETYSFGKEKHREFMKNLKRKSGQGKE